LSPIALLPGQTRGRGTLTGRPETRRTLREWLSVFTTTVIQVVFIVIAVLMTATLIFVPAMRLWRWLESATPSMATSTRFTLPALVRHVRQNGKRNPTILLEAGEEPVEYDLEHWAYSSWKNGTIDRYCYWTAQDTPGRQCPRRIPRACLQRRSQKH